MAIDSNILPLRGTWNGVGYSNRIADMISGTPGFIQTNEGRQSRYNANCYTSYIGADGLLGNKSVFLTAENNVITLTPDLSTIKPANICLYLNDYEQVVQDVNQKATNSSYIDYVRPVISFDPKTICIVPFARIAQHDGDTEGLIWSTVGFNNLMNDEVYSGIMENGYTADQSRILAGWGIRFYIGTSTSRSFTNRLIVCAETAPPISEEQQLSNWYSILTNSDIRQGGMRLTSGTITDVRNTDVYTVDNGLRRYDTSTVASENVQGLSFTAPYTLDKNELQGNTMKIIDGTSMFYVWGRYGYEPIIYRYISGNDVLKAVAATGLFFSPYSTIAESADLANVTDNDVYLGVMTAEGFTTGEYVRGADCMDQRQASWSEAVADAEAAGYIPLDPAEPAPGIDPTNYDPDNTTVFPTYGVSTGTENVYSFDDLELTNALKYIYADASTTEDIQYAVKNFLTTNPIDTIHALIVYPLAVTPTILPGQQSLFTAIDFVSANVCFGNVTTDVSSKRLLRRTGIIDLGYIDVYEKYKNFLDYSPYTSIMLYLPFCGLVSLDCDKYMGHRIYIKYVIDVTTGGCTACVLRDNLMTETVNGQIGIQIPLTGIQAAQVQAAIDGAQLAYKQQSQTTALSLAAMTIGAAATVATGGAALPLLGTAGSAALSAFSASSRAAENRDYQLSHIMTPFKTVGGSGSAIGAQMELTPRLYISRPKMLENYDAEAFSKTRGNACLLSGNLVSFSGFTQVSAADLSGIPASAAEKNKLMQLLQAGVFL